MISVKYKYKDLFINDENSYYFLTEVDGLGSSPGIRDTRENRASEDGQYDYGQYLSGRLVTFKGNILAPTTDLRRSARDVLKNNFLSDGTYNWLKWQESGEEAKQVYCKVYSLDINDSVGQGPYIRGFTINFLAIDPRIYSQTEQVITINIPSSVGGRGYPSKDYPKDYGTAQIGGRATINNAGKKECPPMVKMYGPLTNPKIKNNTDDYKEIKVNIVVASGDYLEIDFEDKTIMLNGNTSRYGHADDDNQWWKILSGNNDIEFRDGGGNINAYAQIIFRSAWI